MTFAIGHVQGGTNAGRRIVKPTPKPWICECPTNGGGFPHYNERDTIPLPQPMLRWIKPAYLVRCPDCGTRRP